MPKAPAASVVELKRPREAPMNRLGNSGSIANEITDERLRRRPDDIDHRTSGKTAHRRIEGGKFLEGLRSALRLSQKDLAARLDVTPPFLCQIETGRVSLPAGLLRPISVHLQVGDLRTFGARMLYCYHPELYDALVPDPAQTVARVGPITVPDIRSLISKSDLTDRKAGLHLQAGVPLERTRVTKGRAAPRRGDRPREINMLEAMGEHLRRRRQTLDKTQEEFAKAIGYGEARRTMVANVEAGVSRIASEFISGWARQLGVSVRQFTAFLLFFYNNDLYWLISGEDARLLTEEEKTQIEKIAKAAAPFFGMKVKITISDPYVARREQEVRSDILYDCWGTGIYITVHKANYEGKNNYWITDGRGTMIADKAASLRELLARLQSHKAGRGVAGNGLRGGECGGDDAAGASGPGPDARGSGEAGPGRNFVQLEEQPLQIDANILKAQPR